MTNPTEKSTNDNAKARNDNQTLDKSTTKETADREEQTTIFNANTGLDNNVDEVINKNQPSVKTNKRIFYMPATALRVQVYLAHGLIYPDIYDSEKPTIDTNDIQAGMPDSITLFETTPPIAERNNNLLLSILLTDEEYSGAEKSGAVIYYNKPLPISRLVKIAVPVPSEELKKYISAWIEPDVPVPMHIFDSVGQADANAVRLSAGSRALPKVTNGSNLSERIIEFDRLMGLFAYQRNAARYLSDRKGFYADYPDSYFKLADMLIEAPLKESASAVSISPIVLYLVDNKTELTGIQPEIIGLILSPETYINKERAHKIAHELYDKSDKDVNLEKSFKALFSGDYKTAVQILQKTTSNQPYIMDAIMLTALFKFSSRQAHDHKNVKYSLHDDWDSTNIIANILAVLGAYYGYTALDANETRLYEFDKRLTGFIENEPNIKFHLETRFEREMIESIYQWAFFDKRLDADMAAIYDEVAPTGSTKSAHPPSNLYDDKSYKIKDLYVKCFEMKPLGWLIKKLEKTPGEYVDDKSEVGRCLFYTCFFHADEYELSKKQGKQSMHYRISKQRLVDLIANGNIQVNPSVLMMAIEEDRGSQP